AKLVVPVGDKKPVAMHLRLGVTIAHTVRLKIKVDGKALFDDSVAMGFEWPLTFDLSAMQLGNEMTIEIESDTHVPAELMKEITDRRTLGVCVRGITLIGGDRSFTNVPLGIRALPEIAEEGLYFPERVGEQLCRWTNGTAKLTVPLRGAPPKS